MGVPVYDGLQDSIKDAMDSRKEECKSLKDKWDQTVAEAQQALNDLENNEGKAVYDAAAKVARVCGSAAIRPTPAAFASCELAQLEQINAVEEFRRAAMEVEEKIDAANDAKDAYYACLHGEGHKRTEEDAASMLFS